MVLEQQVRLMEHQLQEQAVEAEVINLLQAMVQVQEQMVVEMEEYI